MEVFTVSFFGHRQIDNAVVIDKRLDEYISDLICKKDEIVNIT